MKTPFFGAHYVARSFNLDDQRCINLYPELVETRRGKAIGALYMTPGLDPTLIVGNGAIRGLRAVQGIPTGSLAPLPKPAPTPSINSGVIGMFAFWIGGGGSA